MAKATLLDATSRSMGGVTAEIDLRSNKPVSMQADEAMHRKAGLLFLRWFKKGEHYGRIHIRGHAMKFDLRHYLFRDMCAKDCGKVTLYCRHVLNGPSEVRSDARFHAVEIGRLWHTWNNDPRPALIEDDVPLPDGTTKRISLELRPFLSSILGNQERKEDTGKVSGLIP